MNIVKVMGGLGNQFFQYAFAKQLEYSTGNKTKLDISFYESSENFNNGVIPIRYFMLDKFNCQYEIATTDEIEQCNLVLECDYVNMKYDNAYFVGYWQREAFFKDVREQIKKDIVLKEEFVNEQARFYKTDVAIHVRRTDYLQLGMPICDKDYYKQAVEIIKEIETPSISIFSDDINWCKRNLKNLCGCRTRFISMGDYTDWYIMNHARYNVIANSSFSFWAAYTNPNSKVIAPSHWNLEGVTSPVDVEGWTYL